MKKDIIITGATGFLGANLSLKLLNEGHNVLGIDNGLTSWKNNLKTLNQYKNYKHLNLNLCNLELHTIDPKFKLKVDEIYHLASPASPKLYKQFWIETIACNVFATQKLLDLAVEKNAKILLASSSEIYGQALEVPQKESYYGNCNSFGDRSLYDESKRMMETLAYQYIKEFQVDCKIPRIHNTYGPYMNLDDGRVIINFLIQAIQGKDITIYGDGSQYRCYTYVDDLIQGFIDLMSSQGNNFPINIGSNYAYTISETANIINELCGFKSKIVNIDLREKDDPMKRMPELALIENKLNWKPKIAFNEGLKKMKSWIENELSL